MREELGIFSVWDFRGDEVALRFESLTDGELAAIQEDLYFAGYGYMPVVEDQVFACTDLPDHPADEEIDLTKTIWLCAEFNLSEPEQIVFLEGLLDGELTPFSQLMPRYTHRCTSPEIDPPSCAAIDWNEVLVSEGLEFGPADIGH